MKIYPSQSDSLVEVERAVVMSVHMILSEWHGNNVINTTAIIGVTVVADYGKWVAYYAAIIIMDTLVKCDDFVYH